MLMINVEERNRVGKGNGEYWGVEGRLQFWVEWLGKVTFEQRLEEGEL